MATRVSVLYSPDLGAPSRYLQHVSMISRKFLDASEVKTFAKNEAKSMLTKGFSLIFDKRFDYRGP